MALTCALFTDKNLQVEIEQYEYKIKGEAEAPP